MAAIVELTELQVLPCERLNKFIGLLSRFYWVAWELELSAADHGNRHLLSSCVRVVDRVQHSSQWCRPATCFRQSRFLIFVRFHMSGLRGLFVGKQKATTDAPDTYTA